MAGSYGSNPLPATKQVNINMMKIVQINACYEYSSTGRTCYEMDKYLKEHGIDSYKFYSKSQKNSEKYDLIGTWLDHKIHALLSRITGRQAYFSFLPTRTLIGKLKKIKPDVIILRNFHSNYINFPLLVNYLAKNEIPTIVVLHDCWFFTGYCCHYTEVKCQKWQNECNKCPLIKADKASWFFDSTRSVFRHRKKMFESIPRLAVVGVSEWITNEGRKAPIFHNAFKFQRIYNWIDLKSFYPREEAGIRKKLGLTSTDFVALGVSMSWNFRKGLNVYIEVAKQMPDIKIVMIGHKPDLQLPSNIISVQPTNSIEELAQYYSMADVLFNFSIQETFGKVAAEALACGTPLIVNNATANPELPGLCGYVVENNNVTQVVDAVKSIRNHGKDFYKQQCVKRANELFEKNKNLEQYIQLFDELMIK